MNKKAIWLCTVFLFAGLTVYSQCNQHLVEMAAEMAGSDAIYIRDFKVKLSKGDMDNPTPTGKFPVYLNKGVNYRFTIVNADDFEGKAIVELTKRGQSYSGNYNFESKAYSNSFEYECTQSSTYQMLINFGEGKEGCAAIVMSMILQDSMTYIEPGIPSESDSNGVLYMWTDTQMQVASSAGKNAEIHVTISQGKISKKGNQYLIRPDSVGILTVKARVLQEGKEIENDSLDYIVVIPPLPTVIIPGENFGILSLRNFNGMGEVQLLYPVELEFQPYKLKQFSISTDKIGFSAYVSDDDQLSPLQINMIKKLNPNDVLYILNAIFIDPEGNEHISDSRKIEIIE